MMMKMLMRIVINTMVGLTQFIHTFADQRVLNSDPATSANNNPTNGYREILLV